MAQDDSLLTDEGEPSRPNKRPRTILACLACRQKKRRCDGQRPQCQRCVRTQTTCEYTAELYMLPPVNTAAGPSGTHPRDVEVGASIPANVSLRFDPGPSTTALPPRASSSCSPNLESASRGDRADVREEPGRQVDNQHTGNPHQRRPCLAMEGMSDPNDLNQCTQRFLDQISTTHGPPSRTAESQTISSQVQHPTPQISASNHTTPATPSHPRSRPLPAHYAAVVAELDLVREQRDCALDVCAQLSSTLERTRYELWQKQQQPASRNAGPSSPGQEVCHLSLSRPVNLLTLMNTARRRSFSLLRRQAIPRRRLARESKRNARFANRRRSPNDQQQDLPEDGRRRQPATLALS